MSSTPELILNSSTLSVCPNEINVETLCDYMGRLLTQTSSTGFFAQTEFASEFNRVKLRFFSATPILLRVVVQAKLATPSFDLDEACRSHVEDREMHEKELADTMSLVDLVKGVQSLNLRAGTAKRLSVLRARLWTVFRKHVVFNHTDFTTDKLSNNQLKEILSTRCRSWKDAFSWSKKTSDNILNKLRQEATRVRQNNICTVHRRVIDDAKRAIGSAPPELVGVAEGM